MIVFCVDIAFGEKKSRPQSSAIEGYVHVLWKYDFQEKVVPNNEFQLRRACIKFRSAISDNLLATIEIDCGKAKFTVKDVYFEYRVNRLLNFVVGQTKMPFSREEMRSCNELLVVDRGEVNDIFGDYGYLGRDIGCSVTGDLKDRFSYGFGVFNGSGDRIDGDYNNSKQFVERITLVPVKDLTVGINSTQRNDSLTGEVIVAHGGDFSYQKWGATVEGEILSGNTEPDKTMLGYYLVGLYRVGRFEPAVKAERLYPDSKETGDYHSVFTYGLNWYFHKNARLQANLVTNISPEQETYHIFVIQAQVRF
ncbi:MAG: hypothetical protein HY769_01640 [Candidatus Stahlbacteria bacterium]|nr:hypothetical protein [Candidatus Stahlbacteria bacterium]